MREVRGENQSTTNLKPDSTRRRPTITDSADGRQRGNEKKSLLAWQTNNLAGPQ